ncbi:AP2/ERF and B3 domain-containing transcription factor At1g50680-like [Impatiens glandulifera]|uniref:AP2/ERF and B3 domain-containing transcription factor At1g50680-like n=1 Tax=Impatiens glandulifera TaxID=253017 RepID=UPI001FB0FD9A|nr:AP2/ERF and B3 domain-containing transcription factor At1g50680-like [Impatiens glandulifera]
MSTTSSPTTTLTGEASKSNIDNPPDTHRRSNKRTRQENGVTSSKFKGVVVQPNGNWGAQIYANHQRVWLGTFKTENEAASAYDSAAIRLRWGDAHKNFPWTNETRQETLFQNHYTTEAILQMIKDGSYLMKFSDFLTSKKSQEERKTTTNNESRNVNNGYVFRTLFQKELTPSDVGKLNRLVIPKKYAIRYFPRTSGEEDEADDTLLIFLDTSMRTWRFRYCYWKSSQSYVFTRGWNRFVKENKLNEKDMIMFSMCECLEGPNKGHKFFMIGIAYGPQIDRNHDFGITNHSIIEPAYQGDEPNNGDIDIDTISEKKEINQVLGDEETRNEEKGFRLFGVDII